MKRNKLFAKSPLFAFSPSDAGSKKSYATEPGPRPLFVRAPPVREIPRFDEAVGRCVGKIIEAVVLGEMPHPESPKGSPGASCLVLTFGGGTWLKVWDSTRKCCEKRYMSADGDDLTYYVGAKLLGMHTRKSSREVVDDGADVHDIQFIAVQTSKGEFVLSSHNEHNGYYSGIDLAATTSGFAKEPVKARRRGRPATTQDLSAALKAIYEMPYDAAPRPGGKARAKRPKAPTRKK